ncbi:hypothetical protein [Herbiconiux sp.]|uniref:hypothetical protein n=1 Tax=Herbiconiux sp. TaxID=1871186 RepID=UPI0025BD65D0|nr:hypothetical protein [Herbiconiux sp.]
MTRILSSFDRWANRSPLIRADLARYRVVYAVLVLLTMPNELFTSSIPRAYFAPPPGPFSLLDGPPPFEVLVAFQVLLAVALAALAVGVFVVPASLVTAVCLCFLWGILFSYGKIDHSIFLVLVPLLLAVAGWSKSNAQIRHWPIRLLAVLIGVGFVTAAMPKLTSGWLDPSTQATKGHLILKLFGQDPDGWLYSVATSIQPSALWEIVDIATVVLEFSVILSVLSWKWFRVTLAVLSFFHLGVLLTFDIGFSANLIAYGAFVSWASFGGPRVTARASRAAPTRWPLPLRLGAVVVIAAGALALSTVDIAVFEIFVRRLIVIGGAVGGATYLVVLTRRRIQARRGRENQAGQVLTR